MMSSIFYVAGDRLNWPSPLSKDHLFCNSLVETIMNLRPAKLVGMFLSGEKWVLFIMGCWSEQALRSVGNLEVWIFRLVFIQGVHVVGMRQSCD